MRFALLAALVLLTTTARAASPAETAWAAFVSEVALRAQQVPTKDGTRKLVARPKKAQDVAALAKAAERAHLALLAAPETERPKALELPTRLAEVRVALATAATWAVDPGEFLEVQVTLLQDGGGWDSVVFGTTAYPTIQAHVALVLAVPPRWLPAQSISDPVFQACDNARFEAWNEERIAADPERWRRYLEQARGFVPGALRAGQTAELPDNITVLDPPDASFTRAGDPGTRWPFRIRTIPVGEWADQQPTPNDGTARRAEFKRVYEQQRRTTWARAHRTNCAVLVQRLVVEPLEPKVEQARVQKRKEALAPHVRQVAQTNLVLRAQPAADAPESGRVDRGDEVEVRAGLSVDEATGTVSRAPWLRIATEEAEGWVPSTQRFAWRTPEREKVETLPTVSDDDPFTFIPFASECDRKASAWVLARDAAKTLKGAAAQESRQQVTGALENFCRCRAEIARDFTAKGGPKRAAELALENRVANGELKVAAQAGIDATWNLARCGEP